MKNTTLYAPFVLLLILLSSCNVREGIKWPVVERGKTITFDYAAGFDNGTLFDTSFEVAAREAGIYDPSRVYEPVTIVYGRDPLFIGLEEAMLGMKEGEIKNIRVPPHKAYGKKIEGSTASIPKEEISNYDTLKINDVITIIDQNNNKINTYVKEIGNENLTVDLNHPLAGHYVQFVIILRGIE